MTRTGIGPSAEQLTELVGSTVAGEVVMVNLLKFTDTPEEYGRYEEIASQYLEKVGASLIWVGTVNHLVIGNPAVDGWDAVALVRYPSIEAFRQMVGATAYEEALAHRERGLAATVLICCTERGGA